MIENLQDELNQLEKKQAKGTKLYAIIVSNWRAKNAPNFLEKTWKTEFAKSNNISIIYYDNKSKYSRNPKDILKFAKKKKKKTMKISIPSKLSQLLLLNF